MMKLTNITNVYITKDPELPITGKIIYCTVEVEKSFLWWKKIDKREVCKRNISWFFTDTGEWTPEHQMESLWRAYEAQNYLKKL